MMSVLGRNRDLALCLGFPLFLQGKGKQNKRLLRGDDTEKEQEPADTTPESDFEGEHSEDITE
jgi:hypothetical protein